MNQATTATTALNCSKCSGKGHIEGFAHVSNGICFQCNGTGKIPASKKNTVGYSRAFVEQYQHESFFPENQDGMKLVNSFCNVGHDTAEWRVMIKDEIYFVGQPVCRGSLWWEVPADQFDGFVKHYNKVYKRQRISVTPQKS